MITVFGLGFVGLTTALGFAHLGYKVYGVDVDEARKEVLRRGELPFLEPEMREVLQAQMGRNFFVEDQPAKAVADSDYVFYCVGTPYGENGRADLRYLFSALDATLPVGRDGRFRVLVTKSTIPPGTTKEEILPYVQVHAANPGCFGVANNPEFLREGHCWQDFMGADRIVLGVSDERSKEMLSKLYQPMGVPIRCVTTNTGEFIKYLSNTMLATMISYANEMAHVADVIGDIETAEAFRILHMDKRWAGCAMTS
ncbi:MAG: UDP-glucose/GDP-mannose dehydrogenase family protein [Selenomonas sp.]|nr:UDP-glucose/GDP-mannose dehydrogenase family protein [Selenomonas sp.]